MIRLDLHVTFALSRWLVATRLLHGLVILVALTGCGVSFHDRFNGTEVFKGITLDGERKAGEQLTLTVSVAQTYPVPLQVTCYYEDAYQLTDDQWRIAFQERATQIGQTVLPAVDAQPNGNAKVQKAKGDETAQKLSFQFSISQPGHYFAACITPAAPENGYGLSFTVADSDGKVPEETFKG